MIDPLPAAGEAPVDRALARVCSAGLALVVAALVVAACGGGEDQAIGVDTLSDLAAAGESLSDGDAFDDETHHHSHDETATSEYENTDLGMISASSGDIPDVDMIDVASGGVVNLQSLVDDERPLLFWFWSPH